MLIMTIAVDGDEDVIQAFAGFHALPLRVNRGKMSLEDVADAVAGLDCDHILLVSESFL